MKTTLFVSDEVFENTSLLNKVIEDFESNNLNSKLYQVSTDDMNNIYAIELNEIEEEVSSYNEVATKED